MSLLQPSHCLQTENCGNFDPRTLFSHLRLNHHPSLPPLDDSKSDTLNERSMDGLPLRQFQWKFLPWKAPHSHAAGADKHEIIG